MRCEHCGTKLFETDRCCPACGAPFPIEKSIKAKPIYNNKEPSELKVDGYSERDLIVLAQKISAWNGGRIPTIISDDKSFCRIISPSAVFPKVFLGYTVVRYCDVDSETRKYIGSCQNYIAIAVMPCSEKHGYGNVIGKIYV